MNWIRKYVSVLLSVLVLTASVGLSITNHVCLTNKISSCAEDESCCKKYHSQETISSKCCQVKSVYIKASFASSGEQQFQKFFTPGTAGVLVAFSLIPSFPVGIEKRGHAPPLLKSNRTVLLSTSKLSV